MKSWILSLLANLVERAPRDELPNDATAEGLSLGHVDLALDNSIGYRIFEIAPRNAISGVVNPAAVNDSECIVKQKGMRSADRPETLR